MKEKNEEKDLGELLDKAIREKQEFARILYIDDDKDQLNAIKNNLELLTNWQIDTYSDPNKAIKHSKNEEYDVLITDFEMPNKNGFEAKEEIAKNQPDSMISIMLSGRADGKNAIEAIRERGFRDYIAKPKTAKEITEIIKENILHKKLEDFQKEQNKPNLKQWLLDEVYYTTHGLGGREQIKDFSFGDAFRRKSQKKVLIYSKNYKRVEEIKSTLQNDYNIISTSNRDFIEKPDDKEGDLCSDINAIIVDIPNNVNEKEKDDAINLLYHVRKEHNHIGRILITPKEDITSKSTIESLEQEGAIHYHIKPKEEDIELANKIELASNINADIRPGYNNHLYLIMGPTASGKSSVVKNLKEILKGRARIVKKYTSRPLRENELEGKGDILPIPAYTRRWIKTSGRDRGEVLLKYEFQGHKYIITKTIEEDLRKHGLDVMLVSTDYKQKDLIIDTLPKDIQNKVVKILMLSDAELLKQRLQHRDKSTKRFSIAENQVEEYMKNSNEFDFIVVNNTHIIEKEDELIKNTYGITKKKVKPIIEFLSYGQKTHEDYANMILRQLFGEEIKDISQLERILKSKEKPKIIFNNQRMIEAGIPYDLTGQLPNTLIATRRSHGRYNLVFEEYKGDITDYIRCIETQTQYPFREIGTDEKSRYSKLGLIKTINKKDKKINQTNTLRDVGIFSLTDFIGELPKNDSEIYAINIAFGNNIKDAKLKPISKNEYKKEEFQKYNINNLTI